MVKCAIGLDFGTSSIKGMLLTEKEEVIAKDGISVEYGTDYNPDGTVKYFSVAGGFLEMNGTKCTVLATVAEDGKDIDAARAEAAKKRAEERLASKSAEIDMNRATIALQKALTRLKTKAKVSG